MVLVGSKTWLQLPGTLLLQLYGPLCWLEPSRSSGAINAGHVLCVATGDDNVVGYLLRALLAAVNAAAALLPGHFQTGTPKRGELPQV